MISGIQIQNVATQNWFLFQPISGQLYCHLLNEEFFWVATFLNLNFTFEFYIWFVFSNFFNWTWTYREDSDIYQSVGFILKDKRFETHGNYDYNFGLSILLPSGLNPAWHFWLSTRFSCCLKMKSIENILGYIQEQFLKLFKKTH